MQSFSEKIQEIRNEDPDIAQIFDIFDGISKIYSESLKAIGMMGQTALDVGNTAEVSVSFGPNSSTLNSQGI
ncbi:MAG: hypothetical protein ACTSRS_23100 [Candidatus Helarchaeota archaeon]